MRNVIILACALFSFACATEEDPPVMEWHCWCNAVCNDQALSAEGSVCSLEEDLETNLQAAADECDADMVAAGCAYHNCACGCDPEPTGSCE